MSKRILKISIITPTLNQAEFIEDTIKSVLNQNYENYEHIIIDGGSSDSTLKILQKYPHLKWISEKDNGQADAINKGFRLAGGDIIAWLNSDDFYEENIFDDIVSFFESNPSCKFLYGDITYVNKDKKFLYKLTGANLNYQNLLLHPDIVRQPSCFWHKDVLEQVGFLTENLHVVMDYEFFLRIGKKYEYFYLNRNISFFRSYNENKTNLLLRKQAKELYKVMKYYNPNMNFKSYKFLFGRYLDSLNEENFLRKILNPLRKGTK